MYPSQPAERDGIPQWTFAAFFRGAAAPMVLVGLDHRLVAVNDAAAKLLGYEADQLVGRHCALITGDPQRLTSWEHSARRCRLRRNDGESLEAEATVWRVVGPAGAPAGFGALLRPLGELEAELREAGPLIRVDQWPAIERANIVRALKQARGKLAGRGGAADLLGTKPSTLRSRMKRLAITRPED